MNLARASRVQLVRQGHCVPLRVEPKHEPHAVPLLLHVCSPMHPQPPEKAQQPRTSPGVQIGGAGQFVTTPLQVKVVAVALHGVMVQVST
jgi:hypothetical protein